jgi:hypothetical protein
MCLLADAPPRDGDRDVKAFTEASLERESRSQVASHPGGGTFALVQEGAREGAELSERLNQVFAHPFSVGGKDVPVRGRRSGRRRLRAARAWPVGSAAKAVRARSGLLSVRRLWI